MPLARRDQCCDDPGLVTPPFACRPFLEPRRLVYDEALKKSARRLSQGFVPPRIDFQPRVVQDNGISPR